MGVPLLAPLRPPLCLGFLFSDRGKKKPIAMRSGTSALEAAVLQVGAGPLMGDAFVPSASFIFLFSAHSGQGRALQFPNPPCRVAVRGRTRGGVPGAGPWGGRVPRKPLGSHPADGVSHPSRCSGAYVGERCQLPNPCLSSPCKNAGTCTPVVRGSTVDYTCACRLGFTDELCLTPRDNVCLSNPCRNGGTCDLLTLSEYKCRCPPGWSGETVAWGHGDPAGGERESL